MTHGFNRLLLRGLDQPGGLERKKLFRRLMPIMILPGHHSTFRHGLTLLLDLGLQWIILALIECRGFIKCRRSLICGYTLSLQSTFTRQMQFTLRVYKLFN